MAYFLGIDIGSRTSKGVITCDSTVVAEELVLSGGNYSGAARTLTASLLERAGITHTALSYSIATGHALPSSAKEMATDIQCCARGIGALLPEVRTVIDIQRQNSQVIRLTRDGRVADFAVSERCAGGSGRFVEIVANVLHVDINQVGELSLKSTAPVTFTTGCAVFGESEAISRVAEGVSPEDILAGVNASLADKIAALAARVGLEEPCAISGGGALNGGLVRCLEERLSVPVIVPPSPQFVNARGAAALAFARAGC